MHGLLCKFPLETPSQLIVKFFIPFTIFCLPTNLKFQEAAIMFVLLIEAFPEPGAMPVLRLNIWQINK